MNKDSCRKACMVKGNLEICTVLLICNKTKINKKSVGLGLLLVICILLGNFKFQSRSLFGSGIQELKTKFATCAIF